MSPILDIADQLACKDHLIRILFRKVDRHQLSLNLCLPCLNFNIKTLKELAENNYDGMTQIRLTHLVFLRVNQDCELDHDSLMQQFVSFSNERKCVFG